MTGQDHGPATQVYRMFIRATPERVWDAITSPDLSPQWFFGSIVTVGDRFVGRGPDGELRVDGAVISSTAPHRLEHEWSSMRKENWAAEPTSRVTWEIEPADPDVSLLTLTHDRLEDSPETAASSRGGWMIALSGLKTLIETGTPLFPGFTPPK
jgi:uncharacterized protein YndB with AHSA1/START domain